MKNILKSALMLLVFMLSVSVRAHANVGPEVDGGLAVTGLAFLVGSLAVLRSRLRK